MNKKNKGISRNFFILCISFLLLTNLNAQNINKLRQEFINQEFGMFIHFNMGTFHEKEWVEPGQDPMSFNPTDLDCRQWAKAAKSAGMKYAVLTTKHHDGFCLWDSETTTYDVGSTPLKGRDIVREYCDAFRSEGIQPDIYFSIWDRNLCIEDSITAQDMDIIKKQLKELLTNYGEFKCIVFDGWGNCGTKWTQKDYDDLYGYIKSIQPQILITDHYQLRRGVPKESLYKKVDILNYEEPCGEWAPKDNQYASQQEFTIQSQWFWKKCFPEEELMSVDKIVNGHLKTLGDRKCNFLLNCAPNRNGLLDDNVVKRLAEVGKVYRNDVLVETESFENKGGWMLDQQFMDNMGSPYLLAHGMGVPVEDAVTTVHFNEKGTYYVYARTYNWTSPWSDKKGPGKFYIYIDNKRIGGVLGDTGNEWQWQKVGKVKISKSEAELRLSDLTGFDGRCDAIYFTKDPNTLPPSDLESLNNFREAFMPHDVVEPTQFDLIVVGGGIAGISAAVSAARLGCNVALVNDRPVLGGNNSSEVRVHLGGRIETGIYKNLGNLQKEFGPIKGGNAKPAEYYEDDKKLDIVVKENNIQLFLNNRAVDVKMNGNEISSLIIQNIETGERKELKAPLYSDCTGDATIGYLAGADFRIGRESKDEFGESRAPEVADSLTMGASVQWYSEDMGKPSVFPEFEYGIEFNDDNSEKVTMGEWTWETGMNVNQIDNFEYIRDYGLLVIYSNWSYLKNKYKTDDNFKNRKLAWVAYISGKRESRRLMGDYILKEDDLVKSVFHEDGTAASTWTIDLHFPDPANTQFFPDKEFKSIAKHTPIYPYPIPYRCLYSRNINNLFMAGRNISVTHVALGTVRVMRTTGMMGEVVGMAASLCKKYNTTPRGIYLTHLDELKKLMTEGVGKNLPNNQRYNEGNTLKEKPNIGVPVHTY